jgi:hypothetical protein
MYEDWLQWLNREYPDIPNSGIERLERSLDRTQKGMETDLRTPFYGKETPREKIISELRNSVPYTEFPDMTQIDKQEEEKIGPLSIMLPYHDRRGDVERYWHQSFDASEEALSEAASSVKNLISERSLRVASFITALDMMPKDTSLGLPYLGRDRVYVPSYFKRAQHIVSAHDIYPCILYWRGQSAGLHIPPKQRVVWGFDHAETILGATILYPVLNTLKHRAGFSSWLSDVDVDEAATRLLSVARGRNIISMDYSGFDSSLSKELLDVVDQVISYWFSEPGPARIRLLGDISNGIPLVVPYEVLSGRNGAMPSGSVLTNLRDTIANLIAGYYIGIRLSSPLIDFEVLGDDSVFIFRNDMDSEQLSEVVRELGLESNPSKQFVSTDALHFLQRWHSSRYAVDGINVGIRSPYRALSGMLGYERLRQGWNKYMDTARWIMQAENVRNHPYFSLFVRFLREGDRVLSSGMDPVSVFKLAGGADVIRSVLNIASFPFNVQNPERVDIFETTRILRSLSD